MGASSIGPKCASCNCSSEECIGCNGYPKGTRFVFQGESERSKTILPLMDKNERKQGKT